MTISPPEREQKKEPVLDKPIETDAIPVDFPSLISLVFGLRLLQRVQRPQHGYGIFMLMRMISILMLEIYKKPVEKSFLLTLAT
jgi:hypothetical protein